MAPVQDLARCAACAGEARMRGAEQAGFWVQCMRCKARTGRAETQAGAAALWLIKAPQLAPYERVMPVLLAPNRQSAGKDDDRPDVLELLARLLVPGSYRVPVAGRSTKHGMQPADVAGALGMVKVPLNRTTALAVTQRQPRGAARITTQAYSAIARLVRQLPGAPLDLARAEDRHRLRIVIYDAAFELIWPEKRTPYGGLAKAAKMRKQAYIAVHKAATATLQQALTEARRELASRLYGTLAD